MNEKLMKKNGLEKEQFQPSEIQTEELAEMAYVNSELALAMIDELEGGEE